jgi:uncharacterized membrane protein
MSHEQFNNIGEMIMLNFLEELIHVAVEYGEIFFEIIGVLILLWSGIRGVILYLKGDKRTHLELAHGMSMSLGFLLGGEIIGSVLATDWKICVNIGALVALRAAIVLLLHWESKNEEKELEEQEEKEKMHHTEK